MNNREQEITPSQEQLQKRQEALLKLQSSRGGLRQAGSDVASEELKQARSVLKRYARQEKLRRSQGSSALDSASDAQAQDERSREEQAAEGALSASPATDDADGSSSDSFSDASSTHALQQLRQHVQAKRDFRKKVEALGDLELAAEFAPAVQQRLVSQLLSEDFLENTKLWLSSTSDPAKEQSSTSLEELESCHKQVKHRMKVLKVLLEDTQKELDHVELQLRAAKSVAQIAG